MLGAEVILEGDTLAEAARHAHELQAREGLAFIHPYDDPAIIAGQGTAAKELIEDIGALDLLMVPCGGGGLLSGCAVAAKHLSPECRVVGVEPAAGDDATRSFKTRTLQTVKDPQTIADGARTPSLGKFTFPLVLRYVDDMLTVDDAELLTWMIYIWERMKIVVEPTGALAATALLEGRASPRCLRPGFIASLARSVSHCKCLSRKRRRCKRKPAG